MVIVKKYITPTITLEVINSEQGIASGSPSFQTGDATSSTPDITEWDVKNESFEIEL